jgi:hypothetical protein
MDRDRNPVLRGEKQAANGTAFTDRKKVKVLFYFRRRTRRSLASIICPSAGKVKQSLYRPGVAQRVPGS